MNYKKYLPLIVVSILLAAVFTPLVVNNANYDNSDDKGVGVALNNYNQKPDSYFLENGYIAISTPDDLAKIGKDLDYPLNGKYYLTNNIDFTGVDTNGGTDIEITITVSGNSSKTLKITLDGVTVSSLYAWADTSNDSNTSNSNITLSNVSSGKVTLTIGGIIDSGESFAYSTEIDTNEDGITDSFSSNGNFTPIGTSANPFTGTFDGNGFNIIGLNVAVFSRTSTTFAGLFGYTSDANTSNLGLTDGSIVSISSEVAYAGGIVSYAVSYSSTTITNCYNTGTVIATSTTTYSANAGGIVGDASSSVISNCYNTGTITASSKSSVVSAGGIACWVSSSSITDCYNTGTITASSSYYAYAGGITSYVYSSSITDCYNTGDVSATSTTSSSYYAYAGGIASYASSPIYNCYNTGTISASSISSIARAGGIVGYVTSTTITDSYNTGDVTAISITSTSTSYYNSAYVGGIVGHADSSTSISSTYNTGDITATSSSHALAGGIVGYTDASSSTTNVSNSYNTGDVTARTSSSYYAYAGGIFGQTFSSSITNCYNTGNVTATASSSAYAGGIVGYTYTTIINCYFLSGTVSGNNLVGYGSATIDGGATDRGIQESGAKTEEQLKLYPSSDSPYYIEDTGSIAGWNFTETWAIFSDINEGYPVLRSLLVIEFTTQPKDQTVNSSEAEATFESSASVIYAAEEQDLSVQYQWYISKDQGTSWDEIYGATSTSYTFTSITGNDNGILFRVSAVSPGYVDTPVYSQIAMLNVTYTVKVADDIDNGTVKVIGDGPFVAGSDVNIVFTPAEGYELASITINGTNVSGAVFKDGVYTYVIRNLSEDSVISAIFVLKEAKPVTYTVKLADDIEHGTVTVIGDGPFVAGSDVTIELTPDVGYGLASLIINETVVSGAVFKDGIYTYVIEDLSEDSVISAIFVLKETYTVTVLGAGTGGSYSYSTDGGYSFTDLVGTTITVDHGGSLIVKANANDGYKFEWSVGGDGDRALTITSSQTLSGTFTPVTTLSDIEEDDGDGGNSDIFLYIGIIAAIAIIGVVVFLRFK